MDPGEHELLEREAELGVIERCLDEACVGNGATLVIEGPAGIGKSSLLRLARQMGESKGMMLLEATGSALEERIEFGVVRQILEKPFRAQTPETREALLEGPAAPIAPILGIGEPPRDPGPGRDTSINISHGLYWLTANLSEIQPVLILLDDGQWTDPASIAAGNYVSRRIEGHRIAIIVAARDDEPSLSSEVLRQAIVDAEVTAIHPDPLSRDATGQILKRTLAGKQEVDRICDAAHTATGGNPFYATELAFELKALEQKSGPIEPDIVSEIGATGVRRLITERLSMLGEESTQLAWVVAILGDGAESRHAAALTGIEADRVIQLADSLVKANVFSSANPPRISQPLVRQSILDQVPDSRLATLHRLAFEMLQAEGASDDVLTRHALRSEPSASAGVVSLLRRTADISLRTGAPSSAAIHLRRAMVEPPSEQDKPAILAELGRAEVREGRFLDGIGHLDAALVGLEGADARLAAYRDRAFAAFASGGLEGARAQVDESIAGLGDDENDSSVQLQADLATLAWISGAEIGLDLDRYLTVEGNTRAERTMLALLAQVGHAGGKRPEEAVDLATRALGGGRLIEEDTSESISWLMSVYVLLICEANQQARETIEQAIADSTRRGSPFGRAAAFGARAVLALNEGRPKDAESDGLTIISEMTPPIMTPSVVSVVIRALVEQGKLVEAERLMKEHGLETGDGGPTSLRMVPWARGHLHEALGDVEAVRADVAPLAEDDANNRLMKSLSWRALLARTLSRKGDSEEAVVLADEQLEWASWWNRPVALGIAQRARALAGPTDERSDRLAEAVETFAGSSERVEEARARTELGISLLRSGLRKDGKSQLETGLEMAMERGARGTAELAATELEIAGAAPKRLNFDELTASERRVAEFAAAGRTNREIADELFVTPKTVENHLTRVYMKLGVRSRRDLTKALG